MRLANSWLQAGLGALMAAGASCALLLSFARLSRPSVPSPLYALAAIFLAGTVGAAVFAALWKRVDLASDALVVRTLVGETRVPVASLAAFAVWVETHPYGAVTRFTYVSAIDGSRGTLTWDGSDDLLILLDRLVPGDRAKQRTCRSYCADHRHVGSGQRDLARDADARATR